MKKNLEVKGVILEQAARNNDRREALAKRVKNLTNPKKG